MYVQASTLLALIAGATAAPFADFESSVLSKRANSDFQIVPHNSIKYIPENVRAGVEGNAIRRNGQTYARGGWYQGRYAIMYAFYMQKDQISDGGANGGHRHDWENVVIWIDNPANANPRVFGAAASGHGGYKKTTGVPQMRNGQRLQVEYFTNFPTNHELQFKTSPGGDMDMIDYATVNDAVKKALDGYDWGSAACPLNAANFEKNLGKAWV
ncbi:hypothetical protein MBLNU13_g01167t1 [Cladosporium sp. NU13]